MIDPEYANPTVPEGRLADIVSVDGPPSRNLLVLHRAFCASAPLLIVTMNSDTKANTIC